MDDADTLQAASMAAPEAGAAAAAAPAAGGAGAPGDDEMVAETEDKKPRRIGLIIIGIVFGGFGLWAVTAPLDSAALAPGTVTVEGHRKAVQHLQGGIVKEILVREGQTVQSEEPLLILDDTQARAELGIVTGQYFTARALDDRLSSERDGMDEARFSEALLTDDSRAEEAIKSQREIFVARRNDRLGEMEVLQQRIVQLESQIDGLRALVGANREVVTILEEEIADLTTLLSDGFADKQRLRELQRTRASTMGEIADNNASIASSEVRIGETRLEILQLNKRFITEVVDQLAEAQAQVYDLEQRTSALQDTLTRTVLRAPVGGIVLAMNTHTIGGVIRPGDTLLEIVPDITELVIDARISPQDIDRVTIGADADVRFSAFKNAYTIIGTLDRVSADALLDEQSGMSYFSARIIISDEELGRLEGLQLLPGMPAEVFINTGERTLLQYLITPASNMFARSLIEE
ncbi:MAG: epimerase transport system membrane fusion protein [Halieaceae bacterium]|jgi:epimerase transport system membrane fusion protein